MHYPTKQQTVILSALPLALLVIGLVLMVKMYPLHINSNAGFGPDPSYQYLFSGVSGGLTTLDSISRKISESH